MRDSLLGLLNGIRGDIDFENEKALIDGNIIDSFDLVAIVSEMNDAFDITIRVDDLKPENFNSVDVMISLIERLQNA